MPPNPACLAPGFDYAEVPKTPGQDSRLSHILLRLAHFGSVTIDFLAMSADCLIAQKRGRPVIIHHRIN
jgi:hypothetical protein